VSDEPCDDRIGSGTKTPGHTAGAPYPPATEHSNGPDRRPYVVPTGPDADESEEHSEQDE
jgi:hypothetical protein